jgi:hypothetical protein
VRDESHFNQYIGSDANSVNRDDDDDDRGVFNSEPENDEVDENVRLLPAGHRSLPPPVQFMVDKNVSDEPHLGNTYETPQKPVFFYSGDSRDDSEEEEAVIKIVRTVGVGLGISIAGGIGSTPYKGSDQGVFISRVNPGCPCDLAGLKVGDKLISVNGHNMIGIEHFTAVSVLRDAGTDITMVVTRQKNIPQSTEERKLVSETRSLTSAKPQMSPQTIVTTLCRDAFGLGFSLAGGKGVVPYRKNDEVGIISLCVCDISQA